MNLMCVYIYICVQMYKSMLFHCTPQHIHIYIYIHMYTRLHRTIHEYMNTYIQTDRQTVLHIMSTIVMSLDPLGNLQRGAAHL